MERKERYLWLDAIKILACFLVIVNHSHGMLFQVTELTRQTALFDAVAFSVCKIAVPLFVMTTGQLLLQKETTWPKIFLRILRIGVPLGLISLQHYMQGNGAGFSLLHFIAGCVREPQSVSLWYLYMLPGVYLVVPFLGRMVRASKYWELVGLSALTLILPATTKLLTRMTGHIFSEFWFFGLFPTVVGYLVAGYVLSRVKVRRWWGPVSAVVFTLSVMTFVKAILRSYAENGKLSYAFDSWQALPVVLASLSCFCLIRWGLGDVSFGDGWSKVIRWSAPILLH